MNKPLASHKILALLQGTELLGKERGNLEALSALHNQGATIMVGVSGRVPGGGSIGEEARRRGFKTHEFPMGSHFAKEWMLKDKGYRNRQLKRLVTNSRQLNALIRKWKPSHIHIAAHTTYLFFALALLWNRTPLIFRCGDAPPTKSAFQMFFWKWMVCRSNRIVAISHFIKGQISATVPSAIKKTRVIHNIAPTRNGQASSAEIERLKKVKKPFQLVYVGQIHPMKGVPELIQALVNIDDNCIGCWIIGGNQHTIKIEKSLQTTANTSNGRTSIEWLGFHNDPRPFYAAADWHIAPSVCDEAFGNVVREAQSMGTPSIVSPNGGLPETIEEGKSGLILDSVSPEAIQACIQRAIQLNQNEFRMAAEQHGAFTNNQLLFEESWQNALD